MDLDSYVREQEQPELPSEVMKEKFELWNNEYTLETLSELSSTQVRSRRQKFETEVQVLLTKHRPGRLVANRPSLAHLCDKPAYTAQEWKRAREIIRNEAQKARLRFEQAESTASARETEGRRAWITELVKSLPSPNLHINLR
jgi:hypothetical protein